MLHLLSKSYESFSKSAWLCNEELITNSSVLAVNLWCLLMPGWHHYDNGSLVHLEKQQWNSAQSTATVPYLRRWEWLTLSLPLLLLQRANKSTTKHHTVVTPWKELYSILEKSTVRQNYLERIFPNIKGM